MNKKNVAITKMEQAIAELTARYPHIDHLLAETLLKAHENGTLPTEFKPAEQRLTNTIVQDAVTIENNPLHSK